MKKYPKFSDWAEQYDPKEDKSHYVIGYMFLGIIVGIIITGIIFFK